MELYHSLKFHSVYNALFILHCVTVLKFKPVEKPKQSEPILGVGQRVVENPKPLPIVKAPFKIDAYVDVSETHPGSCLLLFL